jgi:hypothetical protein
VQAGGAGLVVRKDVAETVRRVANCEEEDIRDQWGGKLAKEEVESAVKKATSDEYAPLVFFSTLTLD